jgi:hypothetical protein
MSDQKAAMAMPRLSEKIQPRRHKGHEDITKEKGVRKSSQLMNALLRDLRAFVVDFLSISPPQKERPRYDSARAAGCASSVHRQTYLPAPLSGQVPYAATPRPKSKSLLVLFFRKEHSS